MLFPEPRKSFVPAADEEAAASPLGDVAGVFNMTVSFRFGHTNTTKVRRIFFMEITTILILAPPRVMSRQIGQILLVMMDDSSWDRDSPHTPKPHRLLEANIYRPIAMTLFPFGYLINVMRI
jgi:hypothetical protein